MRPSSTARLDLRRDGRAGAACWRSRVASAPTRSATCSCVSPNSSMSCWNAARLLDRVEVGALEVLDQGELERLLFVSRTNDGRDGLRARPARAARTRRSPAMSSKPSSAATTRMGCRTPCSAMLSTSERCASSVEGVPRLVGIAAGCPRAAISRGPPDTLGSRDGDERGEAAPEAAIVRLASSVHRRPPRCPSPLHRSGPGRPGTRRARRRTASRIPTRPSGRPGRRASSGCSSAIGRP